MKATVYLGLGANLGEPLAQLNKAITLISSQEHIEFISSSSFYKSKAWGVTDQPDFINCAVETTCNINPFELLSLLKRLEIELGRVPSDRWGPRHIDIDILYFSHLTLSTPELTLPHKSLHERTFALAPLAELAPHLQLPQGSLTDLIQKLDDDNVQPLIPT